LVRLERGRRILDVNPVTDPAMRPPLRRVTRKDASGAEGEDAPVAVRSATERGAEPERAAPDRGAGERPSKAELGLDGEGSGEAMREGPLREVPVDWEALEDAFENNAPEVHSYLHLVTGDVLRIVDGVADPQMHARIAADPNYLRVDPVSSREQYRWMERYIPMVDDPDLQQKLTQAIDGKGAFRRFKDVLMAYGPERERWFSFRSERLRIFMEAWLSAHALTPVARPVWAPETPAPGAAPVAESAVATPATPAEPRAERRGRNAESLRKSLRDIADSLGPRDLDTLVAFAEFIRTRRATRSFAHHFGDTHHGQDEEVPSSQELPSANALPEGEPSL